MDRFMSAALDEARKGLSEGGIPIGSVLVHKGKIIGRGHNRRVQEGSVVKHAEMDCLEAAKRRKASVYRKSVLYSTLSPCDMCGGAVILYGIPKVVVGEAVNFKGSKDYMRSRGVAVKVLNDPSCVRLMREFIRNNPSLWFEDIGEEEGRRRGRGFEKRHPSEREQKRLVKGFEREHMSDVTVGRKVIRGVYDGVRLAYPVREVAHMKNIGNWAHSPQDRTIVIDRDVKPSERAGVLVHEAVEQYLQKTYGLPYHKAHYLATLAERHHVESRGGNWRSHEISVFKTKT
jgi:cytosine/creatinine deaminase